MKRTIAILLAILLLIPAFSVHAGADGEDMPFSDASYTAWYCAELSYAYRIGLINGVSKTEFAPSKPVTRAEFVTMLGRMLMPEDYIPLEGILQFEDVDDARYYAIYVGWAAEQGVVKGLSATEFCPDRTITRQEMATMLYRAELLDGVSPIENSEERADFADDEQIAAYAAEAIYALQQQGLLRGDTAGNVNPRNELTRAEAAAMIARFYAAETGHTHEYRRTQVVEVSCTQDGYKRYECECGSFYHKKTGTAPGHQIERRFDDETQSHYLFCTRCGERLDALEPEHIYDGNALLEYDEMREYLDKFVLMYPDLLQLDIAGTSVLGTELPVVSLGRGDRYIFLNGNLHAREYITTNYLLKVIDTYAYAYVMDETIDGHEIRSLLDAFTLVILPCLNPDGRAMAIAGRTYYKYNANGVDLNANFPSYWIGSDSGISGPYAASEPETQAVIRLLEQHRFEVVLDCHTAGNFMYYTDPSTSIELTARAQQIARAIWSESGFYWTVCSSAKGGLANYARHSYGCPGLTVEMWPTLEHPIDCTRFSEEIWSKLSTMPAIVMEFLLENPA